MSKNVLSVGVKVSPVQFTLSMIEQLGELIGFDSETGEIRNNRPEQVSTKSVVQAWNDGNYDPTVATIRINSVSCDCVDGGNTYRAIRTILSSENAPSSVGCILLLNDEFSFYHYNTLEAKRKPSQVLEMACGDGWGKFKEQLFTLGCLRSQGMPVQGGGNSGKTWAGKVYKDTKSISDLLDNEVFFQFALNLYAKTYGKSKHTLARISDLLKETVKGFNVDSDGAMLLCAVLDETVTSNVVSDFPNFEPIIDSLVETLFSKVALEKLQAAWTTKEGVKVTRVGRYALLCSLVRSTIKGSRIESTSTNMIPSQGIALLNSKE